MTNRTLNLTDQLYTYLLNNSLREHPVLTELREITSTMTGSQMQISPEQGQFMALLIQLIHAKKALEIGVFTGYSSLVVALALPEDGQLIACDITEDSTKVAEKFWQKAKVAEKIDLRIAPALKTLDTLIANNEQNSFDFIFIDADKQNYSNYYEKALILIRQGGLILIDNVLWNGKVADPENQEANTLAIRHLNKLIAADDRVDISLLPIADGLTILRKR